MSNLDFYLTLALFLLSIWNLWLRREARRWRNEFWGLAERGWEQDENWAKSQTEPTTDCISG